MTVHRWQTRMLVSRSRTSNRRDSKTCCCCNTVVEKWQLAFTKKDGENEKMSARNMLRHYVNDTEDSIGSVYRRRWGCIQELRSFVDKIETAQ